MDIDYKIYLKTRLCHAQTQLNTLNEEEKSSAVLLANINGIRNILFEILDYSVNHFPGYTGKNGGLYFPLLKFDNSISELNNNGRYKEAISLVSGKIVDYFSEAYSVIFDPKYEKALLLLNSFTKHRNEDVILKKKISGEAIYHSFGNTPELESKMAGGYRIGAFDLGLGSMGNCVMDFVGGGTVIVEKIESFEIDGSSLVIIQNDNEHRVLIKKYLKNCLDCCEKIIEIWNKF